MYDFNDLTMDLEGLVWQSDWNGHEVGFDEVEVVGLYMQPREHEERNYYFYIDFSNNKILEFWADDKEDY